MEFRRLIRHLLTPGWKLRRAFPEQTLQAITKAIAKSESSHSAEIRFAMEASLKPLDLWRGKTPQQRAREVFSRLEVWDTAENNGVLIYLLLADKHVQIMADRGAYARIGGAALEEVCRKMEAQFGQGRFEAGALVGIEALGALLGREYPSKDGGANELGDSPKVL